MNDMNTANTGPGVSSCPLCNIPFASGDPIVACPSCGARHHVECWKNNRGCSRPGCTTKPAAQPAPPPRPSVGSPMGSAPQSGPLGGGPLGGGPLGGGQQDDGPVSQVGVPLGGPLAGGPLDGSAPSGGSQGGQQPGTQCKTCGYLLGPLDRACPRCAKGIPPRPPQGQRTPPPGSYGSNLTSMSSVNSMGNNAGFGIRFAALFIDGLILGIVMYVIMSALGIQDALTQFIHKAMVSGAAGAHPAGAFPPPSGMPTGYPMAKPTVDPKMMAEATKLQAAILKMQMISLFINLFYFVGMNAACGATLGKMAVGIKIVQTDGSPIGFGKALLRFVVQTVLASVSCGLAYLVVAFNAEKRGLHDMAAGTVVRYKN